jgi:hypothetical protein
MRASPQVAQEGLGAFNVTDIAPASAFRSAACVPLTKMKLPNARTPTLRNSFDIITSCRRNFDAGACHEAFHHTVVYLTPPFRSPVGLWNFRSHLLVSGTGRNEATILAGRLSPP